MEKLIANTIRVVLALALATPLVVVSEPLPEIIFPFVVGKALYFRVLVEIAFFLWLPLWLWYPAYRPPRSWLLGLFGVYVAIALGASLTGVSVERSLWSNYERMQGWLGLIHYAAFTVMVASVFRTFRAWRGLLNVNLLIGLLVGLLGLLQMVRGDGPRISSSLGNPTFLGAYALVNALIAAGFLTHALITPPPPALPAASQERLRYRHRKVRRRSRSPGAITVLMHTFWATATALNLFMLFQSGTRGAMVGLVAGLGLLLIGYAAVWGTRKGARLAAAALIGAGLVLIAGFYLLQSHEGFSTWTTQNPTLQRLAQLNLDDPAIRTRLLSIDTGFDGFKARPLLGWGPENYSAAYDLYITEYVVATSPIQNFDQAHNRVIEELVTTGLLGLAGYLALWWSMAWVLMRRIGVLPAPEKLFVLFVGAALAGYFVQNLFLFDTPSTAVQLYLLMGFIVYLETIPVSAPGPLEDFPGQADGSDSGFLGRASPLAKTIVTALASAVVLSGFYFTILGPFTGARNAHAAILGQLAWSERFVRMSDTLDAAPALAPQPLLIFLNQSFAQWEELTGAERQRALALAQSEGEAILARVPWEWRAHVVLAFMYQRVSLAEPAYVILARDHTDRAGRIAPHRSEILQLRAQQYVVEGDSRMALDVIDAYFARTAEFLDESSAIYERLAHQRSRIVALE